MTIRKPLRERILEKVYPEPNSGCWLWTGALTTQGYGAIAVEGTRRKRVAHRLLYEMEVGAVPPGLCLDHKCRVRSCVNPSHLEAVTLGENCLRGVGSAADNAKKTHCKRGHPLSGENLRYQNHGKHRRCAACEAARDKARRNAR